jgi:hypothetical protein
MMLMYGAGLISALLGIGSGVLKNSGDGYGHAIADQSPFGDVQFHDWRDSSGQCERLFHARLYHHRDRRTGGIWLSRWGDRGRAHAFEFSAMEAG